MALFRVSNERAQFDAAGNDARDQYGAGIRFTQGGNARVTTGSATHYNQGIPMSATGQVAIVDATAGLPAGTIFHNGLPISGDKVCVSRNATAVVSNGLPYDSAGAVAADVNLDLNFIGTDTLNSSVTFTRASTATYFDSAGVLQSAAINTPRLDYNPSTLAAQGLLIEEQRTNLLLQSENFATSWLKDANSTLTVDTGVAPDGLIVADKLAVGTSTFPQITQSVTSSASGTYTLSCFVKASGLNFVQLRLRNTSAPTNFFRAIFDLSTGAISLPSGGGTGTYSTGSATFVGNGWWRLSITGVPDPGGGAAIQAVFILTFDAAGTVATPTNSSATDGVLFFGAQIEVGAFATSYIPTVASQVTRSADVASVNTLSPWYNATEGTLYAEYTPYAVTADSRFASIDDGTAANRIMIWGTSGSARTLFLVRSSSVDQADLQNASTFTTNTTKTAGTYKANDFAFSVNGATALTDTSGSIPAVTQLVIGGAGGSTAKIHGHIRRITYYPRRLSNAELQAITA